MVKILVVVAGRYRTIQQKVPGRYNTVQQEVSEQYGSPVRASFYELSLVPALPHYTYIHRAGKGGIIHMLCSGYRGGE